MEVTTEKILWIAVSLLIFLACILPIVFRVFDVMGVLFGE